LQGAPDNINPVYAYRDQVSGRMWYTHDGDKESGRDLVNCPEGGAAVVVTEEVNGSIRHRQTFCLGRGHHVVEFSYPTEQDPSIPRRAFVTSLLDGVMDVIGNDEGEPDTFMKVIKRINLLEADREDEGTDIPNNAFPHGMVFSPHTGRIYSLNNGYKTVVVVNPHTLEIEKRFVMQGSNNLLLSPCGRYLVGKGADRKSDPEHVNGTLPIMDIETGEILDTVILKDVYPSTYRFAPGGDALYVTTATTGKGAQRDNLKNDVVLVFDARRLPELPLVEEVKVGLAANGRRPHAFLRQGEGYRYAFVPNPTDGTVSILDSRHHVLDTVTIAEKPASELAIELWQDCLYGC
ncbi:MAG: hypothetical protein D6698_09410, partial [Gammaproteobacteria bacterium]